jgi:cytochrome c-type biogenesis protein CcmE
MAQATWEKTNSAAEQLRQRTKSGSRLKFLIGGVLILAAVGYLILSGTATSARYFITVDDVVQNPAYVGQTVRISGAVIGTSIQYDPQTLTINFTMANIPAEFEDLAKTLHESVEDPNVTHLNVVVNNEVKPDLLQNEAQAILTGKLADDGVFYASELLLKCPSRYQEVAPLQSEPEA